MSTPSTTVPDLSVVVLAYQEEGRIGRTLLELAHYLSSTGPSDVEVLVVAATRADGTTDRTADIALEHSHLFHDLRVLRPGPKVGKGRDAKVGMLAARGQWRIYMDADLATPLHHLPEVLEQRPAQAVIGVRDLTSSHRGMRKHISRIGNRLVQAVLLPGIIDTQCGFKLFSAHAAEEVFARQTILGWGFDMEVLAITRRLGIAVVPIDIADWKDVEGGSFASSAFSGTLRTLKDLGSIKRRVVFGSYRATAYDPYPEPAQVLESAMPSR